MIVLDMLVNVRVSDLRVAFDVAAQRTLKCAVKARGFVGPNEVCFRGEIALFEFAWVVYVIDDLGEGKVLGFYRRAFAGRTLFDLWQAVRANAVSCFALENRW